jgi:hypothetical protein
MAEPHDLLKARRESAALLGLGDIERLSPADTLRCDLISTLRLAIDGEQATVLDGGSADLAKLITATENLIRLLPGRELPAPASSGPDPREAMLRTYKQMRERGQIPPEGLLQAKLNEQAAEIERLCLMTFVTALCKSMVSDQKAYGLDEEAFTKLATEEASRRWPDMRPDAAFAKLFSDLGPDGVVLRKAHNVVKNMPFRADVTPLVVGGEDTRDLSDESEAIAQLKELGARKWPSASALQQFERALTAPENRELAAKAHRRPTPPVGGAYPFPR